MSATFAKFTLVLAVAGLMAAGGTGVLGTVLGILVLCVVVHLSSSRTVNAVIRTTAEFVAADLAARNPVLRWIEAPLRCLFGNGHVIPDTAGTNAATLAQWLNEQARQRQR